jgi:hypothetical protein
MFGDVANVAFAALGMSEAAEGAEAAAGKEAGAGAVQAETPGSGGGSVGKPPLARMASDLLETETWLDQARESLTTSTRPTLNDLDILPLLLRVRMRIDPPGKVCSDLGRMLVLNDPASSTRLYEHSSSSSIML